MSSDHRSEFVQRLAGVRDLKKILETTVKEMGDMYQADCCQIMLSNPLDPNVTSICEFRAMPDDDGRGLSGVTMPLVLHGRTFGSLSMSRRAEVTQDEVNSMRVILGELGDIVRHAQINDIVQRDTFRDTFLVEIGNVMAYSLGIGDALFMVVNILGKVLQASRCLFVCTDDSAAGWKCYEFWQQEKVQSCQEYRWPTTDSPVIAQTLLSTAPLRVFEGQTNSYVSPVQEELQFIGVKSLLGVALKSSTATHGCVILQQCDYRRAWTRNEVDMVQKVADKVADALAKLPAEKRAREPIMQLHQRIVSVPDQPQDGKTSYDSVRKALKGALGQQAIPSARATSAPPPPAKPAPAPPPPTPTPPPAPAVQPVAPPPPAPNVSPATTLQGLFPAATPQTPPAAPAAGPTISPVQSRSQTPPVEPGSKSLGSILGNQAAPPQAPPAAPVQPVAPAARGASDPYADLDFGDLDNATPEQQAAAGRAVPGRPGLDTSRDPDATWGNLDAIQPPQGQSLAPENAATAAQVHQQMEAAALAAQLQQQAAASAPPVPPVATPQPAVAATLNPAANPVAAPAPVPTPAPPPEAAPAPAPVPVAASAQAAPAESGASPWGDLDAIAAPSTPPRGLGGFIGKARAVAAAPAGSALMASFHKDKSRFAATADAPPAPGAPPQPAAAPAPAPAPSPADEAAAAAKLEELLKAKTNQTSDYIFATPGLDMRMLGRIDGWVSQIEQKDKYVGGHARQVAELSCAIAQEAGLSAADVDLVRQAALVHDVGKLGSAAPILQKPDEELSDPDLITVMKHPLDGAELLESFPDLQRLAPIVRSHHEEFNGNGYPQGLKGDEIPVAARIIHVANSYHSMVCPKRYGPGMTPAAAQQELVKGAGQQWDPTFVQMLIQAIMGNKVSASF
ncbi:MAG: HD domain-containing protein [Candidatus Melainabacteria bacterium]|nr:MAG: HD domain-containing protein [Candidatus Melainabacteria bacterium]